MEATEGTSHGVTVIGAEDPSNYHVAPRTENPPLQMTGVPPVAASPATAGSVGTSGKKKRGRPRKYGPDGAIAKVLSPMPLSISAPPATGDFPAKKPARGRPIGACNKQRQRVELENSGEYVPSSAGGNFTPHVITVNTGEDVTMKIIALSQQGPRAICIMSANGAISNVTIRRRDSSGDTMTYEGHFDILSLTGSFTPVEVDGSSTTSRAGSISITLAGADGRVIGGRLGGLLIAASPVQVTVGSFLPSTDSGLKLKKQKTQSKIGVVPPGFAATSPLNGEKEGFNVHDSQYSSTPNLNFASPSNFAMHNWANMQHIQDSGNANTDINISLQG